MVIVGRIVFWEGLCTGQSMEKSWRKERNSPKWYHAAQSEQEDELGGHGSWSCFCTISRYLYHGWLIYENETAMCGAAANYWIWSTVEQKWIKKNTPWVCLRFTAGPWCMWRWAGGCEWSRINSKIAHKFNRRVYQNPFQPANYAKARRIHWLDKNLSTLAMHALTLTIAPLVAVDRWPTMA